MLYFNVLSRDGWKGCDVQDFPLRVAISVTSLSLVFLILAGCATTKIVSQVNWEHAARKYNSIAVRADIAPTEMRIYAEDRLVSALKTRGLTAVPYYQVFPRGERTTVEGRTQRLKEMGVEAVLALSFGDMGYSRSHVPGETRTQVDASAERDYWGDWKVQGSATSQTSPGYDVYKPWATFGARLTDLDLQSAVWIASAGTGGNALARSRTILNSVSDKIVVQLDRDGFLAQADEAE